MTSGQLGTLVAAGVRADLLARRYRRGLPANEPKLFYVYFVSAKVEGYPIKIGLSTDRSGRFQTLKNAMPYDIDVLGYMAVPDKSAERTLHKQFAHIRLRREWFARTPELLAFIESQCG